MGLQGRESYIIRVLYRICNRSTLSIIPFETALTELYVQVYISYGTT